MTAFWRQVGLNYINYSQICARVVRQVLKEPFKTSSAGRDDSVIKTARWEAGKVTKTDGKLIA
uniref:ATP synthase subunit epsilon, mitochondrial n=1 Tax=Arion vulgaris TaxID=1028688 RepID=A0A0B6ZBX6_9EUPU